jgi:hypothetical protein
LKLSFGAWRKNSTVLYSIHNQSYLDAEIVFQHLATPTGTRKHGVGEKEILAAIQNINPLFLIW